MDHGTADFEHRKSESYSRASSASFSLRRRSISFSSTMNANIDDDDIESESVSEVGDIGDRELRNGVAPSTSGHTLLYPYGYWTRDPVALNSISPVSPLPEEIISPLSTDAIVCSKDRTPVSLQTVFSFVYH